MPPWMTKGLALINEAKKEPLRVLWFTNVPVAEASATLGLVPTISGGWLTGLFDALTGADEVRVAVAFPSKRGTEVASGENADYWTFPSGPIGEEPSQATLDRVMEILETVQPDLVHVFGTEFQHSESVMRMCREAGTPTVLQMQGVMGSIAQHYTGWLPKSVVRRATLYELLRSRSLRAQGRLYARAANREARALANAGHVLGRTSYDRAWVEAANPAASYHRSEENLRAIFYGPEWSVDGCEPHTVLVGQPGAPYKGAHIALQAMPLILACYPDARLLLVGDDPIKVPGPGSLIRRSTYGWYLWHLLRKYRLRSRVCFLGALDEREMLQTYLKSNVFVSCSSVENSSNAVCEAQMLGMPVVASEVGGTPDLVTEGRTGLLYQGDSPEMLAKSVIEVLEDRDYASRLGRNAREAALIRHDSARNVEGVLEVYRQALTCGRRMNEADSRY